MKKLRKRALYAGLMLCFLFSALPAAAAETESELTDSAGEEITGIISAMDNEIALLLQNAGAVWIFTSVHFAAKTW